MLNERLKTIASWVRNDPDGSALWDVLGCVRGPDHPSETPSQPEGQRNKNHMKRRNRKFHTVARIRYHAFGQCQGAMTCPENYVLLPPAERWTHFDKHVARAAHALGLRIEYDPDSD